MRTTNNLSKTGRPKDLVELLLAAEAVKSGRRRGFHPSDILTSLVTGAVTLALKQLEQHIHRCVCGYVTSQNVAWLNQKRQKLQQTLWSWLRITPGRVAVKV